MCELATQRYSDAVNMSDINIIAVFIYYTSMCSLQTPHSLCQFLLSAVWTHHKGLRTYLLYFEIKKLDLHVWGIYRSLYIYGHNISLNSVHIRL